MSTKGKDIATILFMTIVAALSIIYFYLNMNDEQRTNDVDLYALIADSPEAVLAINRPLTAEKNVFSIKKNYDLFASLIPDTYLKMVRENTGLSEILLSFHPQGIIFYAKASKLDAKNIQRQLNNRFAFMAQKQKEGEVVFHYYPDTDRRFFGYYYHQGAFVASYSGKLLKEVAQIQSRQGAKQNEPWDKVKLRRKLAYSTPISLLLPANKLNLYVRINDTTEWRIKDQWLETEIFTNEGNICCFGQYPFLQSLDSLYKDMSYHPFSINNNPEYRLNMLYTDMGDTLATRLKRLFPQIKTTAQVNHDEAVAYFTVCGM